MSFSQSKFYRDERNAKWLGVCSGLANYTGLDVTLIRIIVFVATLATFPSLLLAYWLVAWIADPEPRGWNQTMQTRRSY